MSTVKQRKHVQERESSVEDASDYEKVMKPSPVPVVVANHDHTFSLDEEALTNILTRDEVKDRYVVVVSVAGAFRHGKSFLLDFFIRYLNSQYVLKEKESRWLGLDDQPLLGFSWRGGSERHTTGIIMWSEVFLTELESGEKLAVVLLDTQGTWDSKSTVRECATIFALSTMLSSVQIFNLSGNIQEDDLQHLQLFTEYGRLALENTGATPFQRLQFLVRDWRFPYESPYGDVGGGEVLEKRLQIDEDQHHEIQSVRKHIRSLFTVISCFLMPHPGMKVATSPTFDGRLGDIESEFKDNLRVLVPMLLAPEKLVIKEINRQKITCKDLLYYFKAYMQIYKGNELPQPKSMLEATAEANNLAAVASAKDHYVCLMDEICGADLPYINKSTLDDEHHRFKDQSISKFISKKKMGGEHFSEVYKEQLIHDIDELYQQYKLHNENKRLFGGVFTPLIFLVFSISCYICSFIFGLFGAYTIANLFNLGMGLGFIILGMWAYVKMSGEFREFGMYIDQGANLIYGNCLRPIMEMYSEGDVEGMVTEVAERAAKNMAANHIKKDT